MKPLPMQQIAKFTFEQLHKGVWLSGVKGQGEFVAWRIQRI